MRKPTPFLVAVIALTMVGCSEVPEDVKSRAAETHSVVDGNGQLRYVTLSEAAEDVRSFSCENCKALKFNCTPQPVEAENLYTIEMTLRESFNDDAEKDKYIDGMINTHKSLFGNEIDRTKIDFDGSGTLTYFISNGTEHFPDFCTVYANNSFMFTDMDVFDKVLEETSSVQNRADINTYTDLTTEGSEILKVGGKDFDVHKAGKYAEEQIKKYLSDYLNEGESVKAVDAMGVRGNDGELSYVQLRLRHTFEGLTVNEDGLSHYEISPMSDTPEMLYIRPSSLIVLMTADNEIFSYASKGYYGIKEKQKIDRIIPLSQAAVIANNSLAQNISHSIKEVALKYVTVLICPGGKNSSGGIEMHPMWSFVMNRSAESYYDFCQSYMIFVDAIDGKVYYCTPDMVFATDPILE